MTDRFVLWASPTCRAASLFQGRKVPRHAYGNSLQEAWQLLETSALDADFEVMDAVAEAGLERADILSVVGASGAWTAYAVKGPQTVERHGRHPERALASAVAAVPDLPTPASGPAPAPRPRRSVQPTLF